MKKLYMILAIFLLIFVFAGCGKQEPRINIENADEISIFYGVSSYAPSYTDEKTLKALSNCLHDLRFETTDKQMDRLTMFSLYFTKDGKKIASIKTDENGVFWLNGKTDSLKIASGKFNYNDIKDIYEKSRNSNK